MDPKNLLVGLLIALAAGTVFIAIMMRGKEATETGVGALMPDTSCPKDATITYFLDKMKSFASETSPISEPAYAVEMFKRYLACKNPRQGTSRFTSKEIELYNPEILACAKAAYVNYGKELDKKISDSPAKEDKDYYTSVKTNLTKEYKTFQLIFPDASFAGKVCNYEATSAGGNW